MIIRDYKESDCSEMAALFYNTVHSVNAADYSKEQLNVWATGNVDLEKWNSSFLEHYTVVAVEDNKIIGFGDIDDTGYLDRLYVHKDYQRKGAAAAICEKLERGFNKIITHASITALPFFKSRGYRIVKEQTVIRDGVELTNYVMEKRVKTLYLIGGTMGVGKTTVSQSLKLKLERCVFLDGDWCWDSNPFQVNDETKSMVMDNICYLLNNFIKCSAYDNIIFCLVMHEEQIIDDILSKLNTERCRVICISLICSEKELVKRLEKDIECGKRTADVIDRSVERIKMYDAMNTVKIDTTYMTADEVADKIFDISNRLFERTIENGN